LGDFDLSLDDFGINLDPLPPEEEGLGPLGPLEPLPPEEVSTSSSSSFDFFLL
jgi:hypothetical protein